MEFLKANGIEDHSFVKEMDYQEVLNSQEIFGDELAMFAKKELQKEASCKAGICREGKRQRKSAAYHFQNSDFISSTRNGSCNRPSGSS